MNAKDATDKQYLEKVLPLIKSVLSGNGYAAITERLSEEYGWLGGTPAIVIDGEFTADQLRRIREIL
jgi:hypothetical protein